ncbi:MAG: hypothetical protein ACXVA9_05340 [Bdellovibrionales bacterium]
MKYLILLFAFWNSGAFATDQCSSVWIFKPYKTCASPAHGLNMSNAGPIVGTLGPWSDFGPGGRSQEAVCDQVVKDYNDQPDNKMAGRGATLKHPTPIGEESKDMIITQQYRYKCEIQIRTYPFNIKASPACGTEDKISYQVGGSSSGIVGEGKTCLSCDNFSDQPPEAMVECLRKNIETVITPKAIELRDSDLSAVSRQISRLLKLNQQVPIKNLQTVDQLSPLSEFVSNHPVQENQNGSGGLGTKPTLQ